MLLNTILLDGAAAPQGGADFSGIFMIVILIVIFYFFMIRPQSKRQKKIREERAKLDKGSKVITQGGIYGKVREVKDNAFVIEISDGVKITVDKNCVYAAQDADAAQQIQPQQQQ